METIKDFRTLKQELKQLASELRDDKLDIKKTQKENGSGSASLQQYQILKKKRTYRNKHIAYSLMRGRTYEQIEPKCREGNGPDHKLIQEIIDAYTPKYVCNRAA